MRMGLMGAGLIGLVCLAGCGPKTVPVSGTVKIKGQAVEGVQVQFISERKVVGFGKTNAEGKFQLVHGAAPGPNKICLIKVDTGQQKNDPAGGMDSGQFEAMQQAQGPKATIKQLIPPEYGDAVTTQLKFDVPAKGTTAANFDL
jgi:hypothetical protein